MYHNIGKKGCTKFKIGEIMEHAESGSAVRNKRFEAENQTSIHKVNLRLSVCACGMPLGLKNQERISDTESSNPV